MCDSVLPNVLITNMHIYTYIQRSICWYFASWTDSPNQKIR